MKEARSSRIETTTAKFRRIVGKDPRPDTMERDLDRISLWVISFSFRKPWSLFSHVLVAPVSLDLRDKEQEFSELDGEATDANRNYQKAVSTLSDLNAQVKAKREELKSLSFTPRPPPSF